MTVKLAIFASIVVLVAGCSSSAPPVSVGPSPSAGASTLGPATESSDASSQQRQTIDGGQVTVVVDWAGPASGASFDVTLDTHSVDLDALDLTKATLQNDRGEMLTAVAWDAPKGGHHREGRLVFAGGDVTSFLAGAEWVEMTLVGIGDLPERTLRWEVPS